MLDLRRVLLLLAIRLFVRGVSCKKILPFLFSDIAKSENQAAVSAGSYRSPDFSEGSPGLSSTSGRLEQAIYPGVGKRATSCFSTAVWYCTAVYTGDWDFCVMSFDTFMGVMMSRRSAAFIGAGRNTPANDCMTSEH